LVVVMVVVVVVRVDQQAFVRQVDHLSCFSLYLSLCM